MLDSLGFADQIGDTYGAALDAALGDSTGVARNLFDAYSPLSTAQLDTLTKTMAPSASMAGPSTYFAANRPTVQGYAGLTPSAFPTQEQMQQIVGHVLNRMSPQNIAAVVQQFSNAPIPPGGNLPEALGKTFEQLIANLEGKIEQKVDADAQAPVRGKKRKKKGGLSKLKKKFKSVSKFAKKTFKCVTRPLQKSLSSFLGALNKGDIFQLGKALTGGLIGGPMGSFVLDKMMKLGGKNNPLEQMFKQVHKTFDLVQNLHQQRADLQKSMVTARFKR